VTVTISKRRMQRYLGLATIGSVSHWQLAHQTSEVKDFGSLMEPKTLRND
jgi:hypothetical protein